MNFSGATLLSGDFFVCPVFIIHGKWRFKFMRLVKIWILLSAWLCAVGWILSAVHALSGVGYLTALAVTAALVGWLKYRGWLADDGGRPFGWKFWRRFRRPAPLLVLVIALLSLAAGLQDAPQNGDTNAYRVPRVLHWLGQSGWHWIHTEDSRLNIAGVGYEWLYTPLILMAGTDRWIFLPNLLAYFLLPGIIFGFLRQMKIVPRVAWWWSWLLATGWCYALQACSTNNDSLSTVYILGAIALALRTRETKSIGDLWLSLLAASVLSAIKPTNLLLLLPCAVAVLPSWRLLFLRPVISVGLAGFCLLASFVPMALLNWQHTGSWKGFVPEPGPPIWWHWGATQELPPLFSAWGIIAIIANALNLLMQNLVPPFFPWASAWNAAMNHFLQTPVGSHFSTFEAFGRMGRAVTAAWAGIGLSVMTVGIVSFMAAWRGRDKAASPRNFDVYFWLRWTPWLALLVFLTKVGTYQNARLIAPFYVLLFVFLLAQPGQSRLVRQRWWQWLVLLVMGCTVAWQGFIRGRQFIPMSVITHMSASSQSRWLGVVKDFYQSRQSVADTREFTARKAAGEKVVGYATICGGSELGMWLPLGSRQVERVKPQDSPAIVRARGIRSVFLEDLALQEANETLPQWLARFNARLVDELVLVRDPGTPPGHLYFVQLNDEPVPPSTPAEKLLHKPGA